MSILDTLAKVNLLGLDPNGGVLAYTLYWRPQSSSPNPNWPGEKVIISSYLPTDAKDLCRCGSEETFGACCQPLPYWQLVCPNPGIQQGHSLFAPQSATFTNISSDEVYEFLQENVRVYRTLDTRRRTFWIYWGTPALETPHGILCFGDFELKKNRTLLMTALSDVRMKTLLDLISPLNLGTPEIQRKPPLRLEKPARKSPRGERQQK